MDLNKKLIDQLSDLSRNIRSLTTEVKENTVVSTESINTIKETKTEEEKTPDKSFLKSFEGIFKKGIEGITKSNEESKGIVSDVLKGGIGGNLGGKIPKESPINPESFLKILGKIPKFAEGGKMDRDGVALVGEKGPEIVNLKKGDEVISNENTESKLKKLGDYLSEYRETPLEKEALENLAEKKENPQLPENKKNEDILLKPEYLVPPNEKNEIILGEESFYESPENLSKREEKKLKDVTDEIEKALNEKTPEAEKENKESSLMGSIKDLLNKKEIGEESRIAEGEKLKRGSEKILDLLNPSKIGENKEVLLKSIQNIIPTGDLGKTGIMEGFSPDLLKKKTSPEIVKETPELKKVAPKEVKKDEAPKVEEKKEVVKKETTSSSEPAKEIVKEKTTEVNNINSSPAMEYKGVKTEDLNVIVNLLSRMATLLEGPLSIESNESPFRPDSRRF
jgi:hypothetical protein